MSTAATPPAAAAKPLAVVTGVGPGTGTALVRRFQRGGDRVAMLARRAGRLQALAQECPDAFALPYDVSDAAALAASLAHITDIAGPPQVVVHNTAGGAFGNFLAIAPAALNANVQVNVMAGHPPQNGPPLAQVRKTGPKWRGWSCVARRESAATSALDFVTTAEKGPNSRQTLFPPDRPHSHRSSASPARSGHSTVTLLARFRGLSTSVPRAQAVW